MFEQKLASEQMYVALQGQVGKPKVANLNGEAKDSDLAGVLVNTCVLVVDNEALVRTAMVKVLENEGANVLSAATVSEAIEKARSSEQTIELVVCDYQIDPVGTGLDLVRQLRREFDEDTPALIVSGRARDVPDVSQESITVLSKPSGAKTLRTAARQLVYEFRRSASL